MTYINKTADSNVIPADYPDPDIIRVDDTYYMVSTTMHFMPGCVILRSYNLVDWEIASYVYTELDNTEGQLLKDNKGIYGQGMWAASFRYHKGTFYICFVANDTHKTYLYTSSSVEGPWKKSEISGFYHDMSLLFDDTDDGKERVFVISGNTEIRLTELKADLSGPKNDGIDKIIITDTSERILGYEGSHFYKINGKYYIFLIHWPKGKMRTEACYVSDNVDGPYKGGDVLCSDHNGWNSGVAQGGIVQTPDGKWFGMLFQDHGALGRIPILVPVSFENDFPVFGEKVDGNQTAPLQVSVPDLRPDYIYKPLWNDLFAKDGKLLETWQWNHTPDMKLVHLSENNFSITTDKIVKNVCQCSNTLTQRPLGHSFTASVQLDASRLNDGDYAGVCALEGDYGFIAITKNDGKFKLITGLRGGDFNPYKIGEIDTDYSLINCERELNECRLTLGCRFNFESGNDSAQFFYVEPVSGLVQDFGPLKKLRFTLDQFVGCRFSLFCYSTKESGGTAVFSNVKRI